MNDIKGYANKIRQKCIKMLAAAGSGHPGGSLSVADIVAVLYFKTMRVDPTRPEWTERDRFILSKGHSCPAVYAALAMKGYFSEAYLKTFRQNGTILGGHPDMRKISGIDMTAGSLGHGLSVGLGMALAGKLNSQDYKVYVLLGDGELQEGQIWEAAMAAAHYKLENLVAIVDRNNLQIDGPTERVLSLGELKKKWEAFGWTVREVDGHDHEALIEVFDKIPFDNERPNLVLAATVKGKGISFMEDQVEWHGKGLTPELTAVALAELEAGEKNDDHH